MKDTTSEQTVRLRPGLVTLGVYVLLLIVGITVVAVRDPVVASPRIPADTERIDWSKDLARVDAGARARASSYHTRGQHHVQFAIDGHRTPGDNLAKWTSWNDDRDPWLAIDLPGLTDVERVVVAHAGVREPPRYNVRNYRIVCLRDGQLLKQQAVHTGDNSLAEHAFECDGASTIRLEFQVGPADGPIGVARIYEVEIYGRPAQ